jgi:hypothetical protein
MPKRSASRPITMPPMPKPAIVSVNGSEASPRAMPKSACTAGRATTKDHMPTLPMRAERKRHGKPHPGIAGIDLAGRMSGLDDSWSLRRPGSCQPS